MFASLSAINFNRPSRKDDLLSLVYILIYLLNNFQLPLFNGEYVNAFGSDHKVLHSPEEQIENMKKYKTNHDQIEMLNSLNITLNQKVILE